MQSICGAWWSIGIFDALFDITDTVSEFHAEAPQATASEGLVQGPYVTARAELEPQPYQ